MDLLGVFQQTGKFFIKLCQVSFYFGEFQISVGSVFVFCAAFSVGCFFLFSFGD